ncbi:hypothetical protein GOEFS_046_00620 [Gordonia effusa NBRC 100432]|uniref:Uncharacterized protein n=1 Tax=Gordonia effusa NBRC 100432 TaxID=1077974 RepID=H0QZ55_9ACTN|nr:hypothetical protein [Gordonia effusa]GAB18106.1 hypothetical protein GOEFS_046_00620 [Gordonia effusa NBRC 100432]
MTCRVRHCPEQAVTAIDLDPNKIGGHFSYPMQPPVCQRHFDELSDPATQWACDDFSGNGPEVLIGETLSELNEWYITGNARISIGGTYRRQSADLPDLKHIELATRQVGTDKDGKVEFHATRENLAKLAHLLQGHAGN